MNNDFVSIYSDGGNTGNGQPESLGAWAYILQYKTQYFEDSGIIQNATNNICELTAILKALRKLTNPAIPIIIYSDSQYAINSLTIWTPKWIKNNWKTSNNKPVKNKDLIQEIYSLLKVFRVDFSWVKGHSGNPLNERVDELCWIEREKYKSSLTKSQFEKEYLGEFSRPKDNVTRENQQINRIYGFDDYIDMIYHDKRNKTTP